MTNQPVLLEDVSVSFGRKKKVLDHLNLALESGECLSILGLGGSGKSTVLKLISGILTPTSGNIHLFGQNLNSLPQHKAHQLRKKIGIAFQQGALFDFMTVRENILFAMENMTNFSKAEQNSRVKSLLAQVNLADVEDKIPSELSGGMRRRVGIVRALATDPALALLDEPTAGLDPVTTSIVIDMIHRMASRVQATMMCVTSSVDVAFRFAPRVALLKDGCIISTGTKEDLLKLDDPWVQRVLTLRAYEAHDAKASSGA